MALSPEFTAWKDGLRAMKQKDVDRMLKYGFSEAQIMEAVNKVTVSTGKRAGKPFDPAKAVATFFDKITHRSKVSKSAEGKTKIDIGELRSKDDIAQIAKAIKENLDALCAEHNISL